MVAMAIQKGSYIEIYDKPGHRSCNVYVGDGVLQGYTSTCVNVKKGAYIESYDERGHRLSCTYVGY